jgi:hypothetical protein
MQHCEKAAIIASPGMDACTSQLARVIPNERDD